MTTEPKPRYVITIVGFANGTHCPVAGMWLEDFDFEAYAGRGLGSFTNDADRAKRFDSKAEAMEFWRRRSDKFPTRADGRPNRPFTASTVNIDPEPEP